MANTRLLRDIPATVRTALAEDIGDGDITAQLIPVEQQAKARVISREDAVICGVEWVNEVFRQVDDNVQVNWLVSDGDSVSANQVLFELEGPARSLLTGERSALNFLQTLSATATISAYYASLVEGTGVKLLDTRKTIPGLRNAQKYAVTCGGCYNHRVGLYDAFLIKENHIMACGSIANAITTAKHNEPGKPVEVEVESFEELQQALDANADIVMLDNFDHAGLRLAVQKNKEHPTPAKLEASGGIDERTLRSIAETGVDYISIGLLTKDCKAVDLSMRFI
ncbi:carboxylating nicotinate-nucleotide diphosphorylase [uncultured Amphritea sp.]|uniref:carboxylating nicotinate-nucleotide diphosphorylase n=1 Tax=uncultured Amphritea sp. TaxID=981605 RepID=UPI0026085D3A|nr:carboxylating nicotinate-nucleotide diphosphorylase [uncultured Amphritea sp.]